MLNNLFTDRCTTTRRTPAGEASNGLPRYANSQPHRDLPCRWWNSGAEFDPTSHQVTHNQVYAVAVPLTANLQVDDTLELLDTGLAPLVVEAVRRNRTHLELRCRLAATRAN